MKIRIRKGGKEVHGLVRDSWMRHVATQAGMHLEQVEEWRPWIDAVLNDAQTEVRVAEHVDDGAVVGVVVAKPSDRMLHWLWTRRVWREHGVARALLESIDGPDSGWKLWWLSRGAGAIVHVLGRRVTYGPGLPYEPSP